MNDKALAGPAAAARGAYPAAGLVAARLHEHFARLAAGHGEGAACVPDEGTIEALLDAAFWASLRRVEGYIPRISLAYLSPEATPYPLRLAQPLPLVPEALVRVAPAVERAGIHLGVWHGPGGALSVWGTTRPTPPFCFVLEV
ncbi:MAG TPA: hypothetical protein VFM29_06685, partial [Vicinamibacteria bacterium]|nr:hypothetical protein [Vicinamibacteria bacterium]